MKIFKHAMPLALCATLISNYSFAAEKQIDKIEAIVNQEVILHSDIVRLQKNFEKQKKSANIPTATVLQQQILDKLINDQLLLQNAQSIGFRITNARLQQTVENIAKSKNLTLAQYKAQIKSNGENYNELLEQIRNELTITEISQINMRERVSISEQEVDQMVKRITDEIQKKKEYHFVHILLKAKEDASKRDNQLVENKAKKIITELNNGADITALAKKYSDGPKASTGGDWGWRKKAEIPTLFAEHFTSDLDKGKIIGPFKSTMGTHIVKILDTRGVQKATTVEVNARHILIKPSVILSDDKAKEILAFYRKEILNGTKTFEELAEAHSQDATSAIKGGTLGWADPQIYVSEFREKTKTLAKMQISEPFRTVHGWHILQLLDTRTADRTNDAIKQRAYGLIFNQRYPAELYAWKNELREEAYIKIMDPSKKLEANNGF